MIPKVKTWRISYYAKRKLLFTVVVYAVNKRFATWAAIDWLRPFQFTRKALIRNATRKTISVIKESK